MAFNEKSAKLIIDGVVYYQVVMTLPSELSELALSNRELLGGLLPKSAWSSLDRSIRTEQGYKAAAISVLHTWNQQLMNHRQAQADRTTRLSARRRQLDRFRQRTRSKNLGRLNPAATSETAAEPDPQNADRQQADLVCEHCGSDRMVLQSESSKPSWRELLGNGSSASPPCYAALRDEFDGIFWDGLVGEAFNAWYLETVLESAKEPPPLPTPPVQLYLPGLWPGNSFQLQSF